MDWLARGIAVASATIAMTSVIWAVLSWRLAGPALRIHSLAYQEELVLRIFNAGRTAETIEHVVLGGRSGGRGGLDLTLPLSLPLRLEPGQTKSWRLNPHDPALSSRWSAVLAGWTSLWLLTGSMRQHRVEVMPFAEKRPPTVGWRLVPRRTKWARYAPLAIGIPVAVCAASLTRPLSTLVVIALAVVVCIRGFLALGTSPSFWRRRVERWALLFALVVSFFLWVGSAGRSVGETLPTADIVMLAVYGTFALLLAIPGAVPEVAETLRQIGDRVRSATSRSRAAGSDSVSGA